MNVTKNRVALTAVNKKNYLSVNQKVSKLIRKFLITRDLVKTSIHLPGSWLLLIGNDGT